jgi:hypothetical protein
VRPLLLALPLAAALAVSAAPATTGASEELLPDLDQRPPYQIAVTRAGPAAAPSFRLVFASAVDNIGAGTLVIEGRRPSRAVSRMRADQLVPRADGSERRVRGVGFLRYVESSDHEHWHLLDFDRYELRRVGDFSLVVRDRKTGFCLGDRYAISAEVESEPVYVGRCGLNARGLLRIREGITPGFGDDYHPELEGQFLDVTSVRPGRYLLVHRANPTQSLVESDYSNNAASVLLELRRPGGVPVVRVLATCPDDERCRP